MDCSFLIEGKFCFNYGDMCIFFDCVGNIVGMNCRDCVKNG